MTNSMSYVRWQRFCALFTLSVSAVSCGGEPPNAEQVASNSSAIINGTPVTSDTRGACYITTSSRRACSANLLTNSWLLTARHCFDGSETSVDVLCPAAGGSTVTVTDAVHNVFSHPTADAALIHLPARLTIFGGTRTLHHAVYHEDDVKLPNKSVYCSGFGLTTPTDLWGGTLNSAQLKISGVSDFWVSIDRNASGQVPYYGDSGSACFYDLGVYPQIVGVCSGADPLPEGVLPQTVMYTRPGTFREWVDQTLFAAPVTVGTQSTLGPAIVQRGSDSFIAFTRLSDGSIGYATWTNGTTSYWNTVAMSAASTPSATAYDANSIIVVARGSNNDVVYRDYVNQNWGPVTSLGGSPVGTPIVVSHATGQVMVLYVAANSTVQYRIRDTTGTWSAWTSRTGSALGTLAGDLAAIKYYENYIELFARTTSGAVLYTQYVFGGWNMNWFSLGGNFKGGIAVTSSAPQRLDLFAINQDDTVAYRKWWGYWDATWTNLGGAATASVAAASRGTGSMDLLYGVTNGTIAHRQYAP